MLDLTAVYDSLDSEEPLPAGDDARYVDLAPVRGEMNIARRLVQRIKNAGADPSHHLVMGHTECGKTTELNRATYLLEREGYATVTFDMVEQAGRVFEYTTVLLIMAGQVVGRLAQRKPRIKVAGASAQELVEFLREREVTRAGELSGEATAKSEVQLAPALLAKFLGGLGLGLELRGGGPAESGDHRQDRGGYARFPRRGPRPGARRGREGRQGRRQRARRGL